MQWLEKYRARERSWGVQNQLATKCAENDVTSEFDGVGGWLTGGALSGLKIFLLFFEPNLQFLKIICSSGFLKKTTSVNNLY